MVVFKRRVALSGKWMPASGVPFRVVMFSGAFLAALAWTPFLNGVLAAAPPKPEVVVAAAANLTAVFQALGPRFEADTGIHAIFSFGATAQLARQIENGAPIDVFTAADSVHVEELDAKRLLVPGSVANYAEGVLALWIPTQPGSGNPVQRVEDLALPSVRVIAIANPKLAPYGEAAVEAMQRAGVWDRVKSRIVYAENINMARQYGSSGNADAVFTAYPLVMQADKQGQGTVIKVPASLYAPIRQSLGIVAGSRNPEAARRFTDYLLRGNGRDLLKQYGYGIPVR